MPARAATSVRVVLLTGGIGEYAYQQDHPANWRPAPQARDPQARGELRMVVGLLGLARPREAGWRRLILDGELVALTAGGRPSFQALQVRLGPQLGPKPSGEPPRSALAYLIFDLLYLDGRSLLPLPYIERRAQLNELALMGPSWWTPPYQLDGRTMLEESQILGLEGVVAKKLASPYRPGTRNGDWLKVKVPHTQPFVIAGWMPSDVHPDRIGSLVLAAYDVTANEAAKISRRPRLVYAGRVGTGFNQRTRKLLQQILLPLRIEHSPLDEGGLPSGALFVRPELVCEVTFLEWTLGGEIRHPSFQRLRTDMNPADTARVS